ncbi:hypothetical protein [Nocardia vermiculata]|uniref:Uncharacterized protein n=1 Tax=Nocardia vermiculata TaxID=257274 RepID=A0A846XSL4_9NOCA|nr:hypothetical protein [Nocardia vermiculata]NKY48870.1 hypothetical protein [Nocardia vermiculata]
MITLVVLIIGIAIGATAMAVVERRWRSAHLPAGRTLSEPSDSAATATSLDRNENAGGSRHIRTHPSWRDRLE